MPQSQGPRQPRESSQGSSESQEGRQSPLARPSDCQQSEPLDDNSQRSDQPTEQPEQASLPAESTAPRLSSLTWQRPQVANPGSAAPHRQRRYRFVLDPHALALFSTQGGNERSSATPDLQRGSNEPDPEDDEALRDSDSDSNDGKPRVIQFHESEIDFDKADPEDDHFVQRRPGGTKKQGSEDVAERPKGRDGKLKGDVRYLKDGSGKAFKDVNHPRWTKGEYHYKLRHRFITADSLSQEPYAFEPAYGCGPTNITSQCTDQKDWTFDPATIRDPRGRWLLAADYRPNEYLQKNAPDWLLEDGTVVLDQYGHPVGEFTNIPSTLSSELEPARMEGLRALNGMTIYDIMARMPKNRQLRDGAWQPLPGPSAFTNRAKRWRAKHNVTPLKKGVSKKNSAQAQSLATADDGSAQRASNEEDTSRGGPTKRLNTGAKDSSHKGKGTTAQRASAKIQKRQAKKPRRGAKRQGGARSPSIAGGQSPKRPSPVDLSSGLTDPQMLNEQEIDPFALSENKLTWRGDQDSGETADLEALLGMEFPMPGSSSQPVLSHEPSLFPTYQPADLPSDLSTLEDRMRQFVDEYHMGTSQQGQTNVPSFASAMGQVNSYQGPASYSNPYAASSNDLGGSLNPDVPAASLSDFRDHVPTNDVEMFEVNNALTRTLDSFEAAHPEDLPPETEWLSYNEATRLLEAKHRELCEAQGQRVTKLAGLGPWYNTLDNWPSARQI